LKENHSLKYSKLLKKLKQWHIDKLEQVQKLLNLSNYEILWVVFFEGILIGAFITYLIFG
tara:strand:+ start:172 stop:351 length:180 start_codon:yes stop_codon:yes gene_type:complete